MADDGVAVDPVGYGDERTNMLQPFWQNARIAVPTAMPTSGAVCTTLMLLVAPTFLVAFWLG